MDVSFGKVLQQLYDNRSAGVKLDNGVGPNLSPTPRLISRALTKAMNVESRKPGVWFRYRLDYDMYVSSLETDEAEEHAATHPVGIRF
jgi:hypothetical protein